MPLRKTFFRTKALINPLRSLPKPGVVKDTWRREMTKILNLLLKNLRPDTTTKRILIRMENQPLSPHLKSFIKLTISAFLQKNLLKMIAENCLMSQKRHSNNAKAWKPFHLLIEMNNQRFCHSNPKRMRGNTKNLKLITICWNKVKTWFKNTRSFRKKNQNWEATLRPRLNSTQKALKKLHSCKKMNLTSTIMAKSNLKQQGIHQYLFASPNPTNQKTLAFRKNIATTISKTFLLTSRNTSPNWRNNHHTAAKVLTKLFHLRLNSCTLEKIRRIWKTNFALLPLLVALAFLVLLLPKRLVLQDCLWMTLNLERF